MLFKSLVCLLLKNNKYSSKLLCANYFVCRCVWSITIVPCSLCVVYYHCSMFAVCGLSPLFYVRCVWSITIVLCSLCVVYHHCSMFAVYGLSPLFYVRCVWSITIVLCSLCVVYHHCSMFAVCGLSPLFYVRCDISRCGAAWKDCAVVRLNEDSLP